MIVWGDDRRTYGEIAERSRRASPRISTAASSAPVRDRSDLARWECGQDRVALLMHNRPEHVEAILGCWKARVVPCNVNYHYTAGEVADLLQRIGSARRDLRPRASARSSPTSPPRLDVLIEVDDGIDAASTSTGR